MRYSKILCFALFGMMLCSCVGQKKLSYFRAVDNAAADSINSSYVSEKEMPFTVGDALFITVEALDPEAAAPFNLSMPTLSGPTSTMQSTTHQYQYYTIDPAGNIQMPILGTIHAEGLTKTQLRDTLLAQLAPLLNTPIVTISLNNSYVTVLGEVARPSRVRLSAERTTILDALAMCGDLTIYGKRDNVLLTREKDGKLEFVRLNLNDPSLFSSPYFFLRQNDVIYVEPNNARALSSQNVGLYLSMITTLASLATVVVSVVVNVDSDNGNSFNTPTNN